MSTADTPASHRIRRHLGVAAICAALVAATACGGDGTSIAAAPYDRRADHGAPADTAGPLTGLDDDGADCTVSFRRVRPHRRAPDHRVR